jgi:iron complex transport system permease protein
MSGTAMGGVLVKPVTYEPQPRPPAGDRQARARISLFGLGAALLLIAILSLFVGSVELSPSRILSVLFAQSEDANILRDTVVVWQLRLPRALLGILVGGALALSGAAMQGLFRNPLADPGLVGVSSGAALAAVSIIVLGNWLLGPLMAVLQSYALPLAAFAGGLITTITLYRIATRAGRTSVATMLLAGIALGALSGAMTGLLVFISDDQQLRDLTFWLMGSLGGATWERIAISAPIILGASVGILFLARGLNAWCLANRKPFILGSMSSI